MFKAGDRIGNYEVVTRLRDGGMATLFIARRSGAAGFARYVALKVVHPHLATDPAFIGMFLDEAMLSARIEHPNVVHVEELGQHEGAYFLAMEYVRGCSISHLIRALRAAKRRLAPALAVWIAAEVASALYAAHETTGDTGARLGVVHRDVTPQNILVSYRGHVKLIDFGIAKARGRSQQTEAGALKGKLRYMSPEQAYGREIDLRTDVYALGIVLWELLTMRRMFPAQNDLAVLELVRNPTIQPPSLYSDRIPPALDAALLAALSKNPNDRPATALEFRKRLLSALPEANAIGSAELASVLTTVMAQHIEEEKRELPSSISRLGLADTPPPQRQQSTRPGLPPPPPPTLPNRHSALVLALPEGTASTPADAEDGLAPVPILPAPEPDVRAESKTPEAIEVPPPPRPQTPRLVAFAGGGALVAALAIAFALGRHGNPTPASAPPRTLASPPLVVDAGVVVPAAPMAAAPVAPVAAPVVTAVVARPAGRVAGPRVASPARAAHPPAPAAPRRAPHRVTVVNGVPMVEEGGF